MNLVQPDPSDHILMQICIIEPLLTFFNNSTFGRGAVGQGCQTTRWWGSVVISCSRERLFSKFLLWLWSMTSDQFHSFCAQYAIHMYATDLTAIIWPQFCQRRRQIVLLAVLLIIQMMCPRVNILLFIPKLTLPIIGAFFSSLSPASPNLVSSQR